MFFKRFYERRKKKKSIEKIDKYLKREIFSLAIIEAKENKLINKEIESYKRYQDSYNEVYPGSVQRFEELGLLNEAMKSSQLEPLIMNIATIRRIKQDLQTADIKKNKRIELPIQNLEEVPWEQIYYSKENPNYSKMRELVMEYNLMEVDNPSWDYAFARYTRN